MKKCQHNSSHVLVYLLSV